MMFITTKQKVGVVQVLKIITKQQKYFIHAERMLTYHNNPNIQITILQINKSKKGKKVIKQEIKQIKIIEQDGMYDFYKLNY